MEGKGPTFFFVVLSILVLQVTADYGLIYAENMHNKSLHDVFCIVYNPFFQKLQQSRESVVKERVKDLTTSFGCDLDWPWSANVTGLVAVVKRGNCTFSEKAFNAQQAGAASLLVVSDAELNAFTANQSSDYNEINITLALIASKDFVKLKALSIDNITVQLYAPAFSRLDYNLIMIWLIAMVTIVSGSYWSGTVKYTEWKRKHEKRLQAEARRRAADQTGTEEPPSDNKPEETLDVSPKYIIIFVVLMCGMLLALFFLYDYLVYAIIGIFCLASCMGLYACLVPLVRRIPCGDCRVPSNSLPLLKYRPEIRRILLALFCMGVSIWWGIERHAGYAWILQDILGFAFSLNMLKTVRIPNLMGCVILLSLLFVYDIFFVFITPLFTKDGNSVMVDVATGGSSRTGETLPMVFKVPHILFNSELGHCDLPYSLLGYGDVLVPGFLVSYVHAFDLIVGSKRVYFIATSIAYGVGLVITFIALALMETGQPALLYLVPCTLLTVVVIGLIRGELKSLWKGKIEIIKPLQPAPETDGDTENNINENANEGKLSSPVDGSTSSVDSQDAHERDLLINR